MPSPSRALVATCSRNAQPHFTVKVGVSVSNVPQTAVLTNGIDSLLSAVSSELSFSWILNEYPTFVEEDSRRFVSQETGHLYIAKVEPSDVGNYTCVVTSTVAAGRVLGAPTPLTLRADGRAALGAHGECGHRHLGSSEGRGMGS